MATPKEYAYYIKGNKIAVAEKNTSFDNDPNSRNYGPGAKDVQWESPLSDVSSGLEVEYTYAPTYNINPVQQANKFYANGWYVDEDGYVNLIRSEVDIAALGTLAADLYINIEGSETWNGVHKIKSVGTETWHGNVQLYTKYEASPYIAATHFNFDQDETLGFDHAEDFVKEGDYIVIYGTNTLHSNNSGLFRVSGIVGDDDISLDKKYTISDTSSAQYTPGDFEVEAAASLAESSIICKAYKGHRDAMSASITTIMEDESFELDIPNYLTRAVIFFVKAKKNEDAGNIDMHEYYMREFKRQVERHETSRGKTFKQIQGFWHLKK